MFTGIVEKMGTVVSAQRLKGRTYTMRIDLGKMIKEVHIGDSIALNGACLTIVGKRGTVGSFDVMCETLRLTNLGGLKPSSQVNIERSMSLKDRISGHFVIGHIDGTGTITKIQSQSDGSVKMTVSTSKRLTSMMVEKGSVALDGISLTLVDVTSREFSVYLIPHTLEITTLGIKKKGDLVNIEADYIGKYVLKLVAEYAK